ncbi:MAG TPA: hypothetical protein VEJ42_00900 [Streptosporangiaceae bacterium]|nr:hypothetical protein [Streptosporangiaceae bacterium]
MTRKQQEQLLQVVTPVLQDGEQVEYMTTARVGQPRRRKQLLSIVISSVLTLGMLTLFVVAKGYFVVLTNQRLMFFAVNPASGRPLAGPAMQFPRARLTATRPRSRLAVTFRLVLPGQPPIKVAFGQPKRRDARELAAAIGVAA